MTTGAAGSVSSHNPAVWLHFHMGIRLGSSPWPLPAVTRGLEAHTCTFAMNMQEFIAAGDVMSGQRANLETKTHTQLCSSLIVKPF